MGEKVCFQPVNFIEKHECQYGNARSIWHAFSMWSVPATTVEAGWYKQITRQQLDGGSGPSVVLGSGLRSLGYCLVGISSPLAFRPQVGEPEVALPNFGDGRAFFLQT